MKRFVMLRARDVQEEQQRRERAKLAAQRQQSRYPKRNHHKVKPQGEFIMWDGESPKDAGYALFANSKGKFICQPFLSTRDCLQLIYETECEFPDAIHIGFGFNLDVSYILKDLPRRQLTALHHTTRTIWEDEQGEIWKIEHIPHKWFRVKKGRVTAKIFDIHSFFASSYIGSLQRFGVGSRDDMVELAREKARRGSFVWSEIEGIKHYQDIELRLGPELANGLREALALASYVPRSWHGPGAVARMAFQRHCVYEKMAKCPAPVQDAARYAFIGGRFNQFLIGRMEQNVYEADINSAYPYYATMLPNLARGRWRHGQVYENGKFAVYHIRYEAKPDSKGVFPLPRRMEGHGVTWPHRVEGWFWAPEAELVKDDPAATFVESLVFDEEDETDRPFAFLWEYFDKRKRADARGDIIAYAFKIIINAIYGQLAQRAGWNRKTRQPPRTHQLEWAGFITSGCRAAVYKAAKECGEKLISINTDSVQALCPIPVDEGPGLGQWKVSQYSDGVMWQAGIYFLRDDLGYDEDLGYGWSKAKTRGIPRGSYQPEDLITAMHQGKPLTLTKHSFIPYTLADNGRWEELNTWADEPFIYEFGGNGFLKHRNPVVGKAAGRYCAKWCHGDIHRTALLPITCAGWSDDDNIWSKPHYLPWIDGPDEAKMTMDDVMAFDVNELDETNDWMLDYAI
jgi:DNA polymerase type B, organellar and viral